MALAICHNVTPINENDHVEPSEQPLEQRVAGTSDGEETVFSREQEEADGTMAGQISYQASSPDEVCFRFTASVVSWLVRWHC